jgi:hypothetical protein
MGWDGMGLWIGQCKGECEMEVATGDGGGIRCVLGIMNGRCYRLWGW